MTAQTFAPIAEFAAVHQAAMFAEADQANTDRRVAIEDAWVVAIIEVEAGGGDTDDDAAVAAVALLILNGMGLL